MLKITVLILFSFYAAFGAGYTNPFAKWGSSAGSSNNETGYSIVSDADGNTYIAGQFSGTADFGSTQLTSYGLKDVFIAKTDTNGNFLWAVKAGGTGQDNANALKLAPNGNLLISGVYSNAATFDTENLTSNGSQDAFLAEYDTLGNCNWAITIGSSDSDVGKSIDTDDNGNIYLTGNYQKTADFGNSVSLTASGFQEAFLAKFDSNGNCQWASQVSGGSFEVSSGEILAVDAGIVYMSGTFFGDADFGNGVSLTSKSSIDIFLAKYDIAGTCQETDHYYGENSSDDSFPYGLSFREDKVALSGFYNGSFAVEGVDTLQSNGDEDAFVILKDTSNNYSFVESIGSAGYDNASTVRLTNKLYVAGSFTNTVDFAVDTSVTSAGGQDMYVAVYDHFGEFEGVKTAGSSDDDYITSLFADEDNYGYITGAFSNTVTFNDSVEVTSDGGESVLAVKFNLLPVLIETIDYNLNQGWNYISTNVLADNMSIEDILSGISSEITIVKDWDNGIYIPSFEINNIGDITVEDAYMVYAKSAQSFSLTGVVVEPDEYELSLDAGWNFIPYLRNEAMSVETALQSIQSDVVIVLDPDGNVWIPGENNTIGNMEPGEGYRIYLNQALNFTYPNN